MMNEDMDDVRWCNKGPDVIKVHSGATTWRSRKPAIAVLIILVLTRPGNYFTCGVDQTVRAIPPNRHKRSRWNTVACSPALSVCLSASLFVCLCLSLSLSVCLISLCVCLSLLSVYQFYTQHDSIQKNIKCLFVRSMAAPVLGVGAGHRWKLSTGLDGIRTHNLLTRTLER